MGRAEDYISGTDMSDTEAQYLWKMRQRTL